MTNEQRKLLEPYAMLLARAHQRIVDMSDEDLAAMDAAIKSATSSNCWYAIYQVAKLLENEVAGQKLLRARKPAA
jgi:hypothetical protein